MNAEPSPSPADSFRVPPLEGWHTRQDVQRQLREIGLPATGPTTALARHLSVISSHPSTWTDGCLRVVATQLSIHQDLKSAQRPIDAAAHMGSILHEGLHKGMVHSLADFVVYGGPRAAQTLVGVPAYVFVTGALRFRSAVDPHLAPGNKPLFAFIPRPRQDILEAIQQTARWAPGREPEVDDGAWLGYFSPDAAAFECYTGRQARAAGGDPRHLVANFDVYSHPGTLRFARYGGSDQLTLSGGGCTDPQRLVALARLLQSVGAPGRLQLRPAPNEHPSVGAVAPSIGTLREWAERNATPPSEHAAASTAPRQRS